VLPNINFRSLVVIIVLCLALSIRMLPIVAPATSSFASVRIIESNGSRIPYIYYGLKPNAKFAGQLGLIAGRKRILEQPSFEFRILKYRPTKDVGCKLLPAASHSPAAPNPPGCRSLVTEATRNAVAITLTIPLLATVTAASWPSVLVTAAGADSPVRQWQ